MKYWSYWKTKNKVLFIVIMSLLTLFIIFKIILPIVKWNLSYDVSDIDTPEKAIEYYFEAISEKNPKKEMAIYPELDNCDDSPGIFTYAFSTLLWCKLENIEYIPGEGYLASYDTVFLFKELGQSGLHSDSEMFFDVRKDYENDNYYIADMCKVGP